MCMYLELLLHSMPCRYSEICVKPNFKKEDASKVNLLTNLFWKSALVGTSVSRKEKFSGMFE